jgi:hypothetical protein
LKAVALAESDRIRLVSAATFKPLGTLKFHRETVHTLAFASAPRPSAGTGYDRSDAETESVVDTEAETVEIGESSGESDEDEVGDGDGGVPPRERWLASGGKDTRVALWGLIDFGRGE